MAVQGTWGIGSFKLPDFGATEWLSGGSAPSWANNPAVYQAAGTTQKQYAQDTSQNQQYALSQQGKALNPYTPYTNTSPSGGNTTTGGGGGGGSPNPETTYVIRPDGTSIKLGDLQREAAAREARIRGNIESSYNTYENRLDEMIGWIPQVQAQQEGQINTSYGNMASNLDSTRQDNLSKIEGYKSDAVTRGKQSTSDLMENLRSMLNTGTQQIGAYGAGRSSATDMLKYAYGKLGAKQGSNIQRGVNTDLSSLDQKAVDVNTAYNSEKTNLEQWKTTNLQAVQDKYMPYLMQIKQAKANAPLQKVEALNRLEEGIFNNALTQINQIESEARGYARDLDTWARNRMAQLDNVKLQIANTSNFDPQQYLWQEMPGLGLAGGQQDTNFYNPFAAATTQKKKNIWEA